MDKIDMIEYIDLQYSLFAVVVMLSSYCAIKDHRSRC